MQSIPKRSRWSSHSWMLRTGALLGLLVILPAGGCDGNGGTGGNGGGGPGGQAGDGGEGGRAGTAGPHAWHEATLIEHDDIGDGREPRLAGSLNGDAVVVWLQDDGERHNVWANTYDPGTGWRTAEPIEHEDGEADAPQVAVSASGHRAMAVWDQADDSGLLNVWVNRYETGWRAQGTILDDDNGWLAHSPQVVVHETGAAKVIWIEQFRQQFRIWTNRFGPGVIPGEEMWWGAERIDTETDTVGVLALVGYEGGGAMAAWRENDLLGHPTAWASRWDTAGIDWEPAEPFANGEALLIDDIRLVADAGRNVMAVWLQTNVAEKALWANRYVPGSGWGDAELLEADSGVPPTAEVAMDPAGNAIVVWSQWDGNDQNIMAKRYEVAGGWQASQAIDEGFRQAANPHVAVDPAGNAMVVWQQRDNITENINIWSRHYDAATGQWAEPELVETSDSSPAFSPRVTLDADGNAIAVWHQWDDTLQHNDIWANRWAP